MIKITNFSGGYCKIFFEVNPIRPANIHEPKLGLALTKNTPDYCLEEGRIYRVVAQIDMDCSIKRLYEMQTDAQEEFSKKILRLKNSVDEFKILLELTKKKEAKK